MAKKPNRMSIEEIYATDHQRCIPLNANETIQSSTHCVNFKMNNSPLNYIYFLLFTPQKMKYSLSMRQCSNAAQRTLYQCLCVLSGVSISFCLIFFVVVVVVIIISWSWYVLNNKDTHVFKCLCSVHTWITTEQQTHSWHKTKSKTIEKPKLVHSSDVRVLRFVRLFLSFLISCFRILNYLKWPIEMPILKFIFVFFFQPDRSGTTNRYA